MNKDERIEALRKALLRVGGSPKGSWAREIANDALDADSKAAAEAREAGPAVEKRWEYAPDPHCEECGGSGLHSLTKAEARVFAATKDGDMVWVARVPGRVCGCALPRAQASSTAPEHFQKQINKVVEELAELKDKVYEIKPRIAKQGEEINALNTFTNCSLSALRDRITALEGEAEEEANLQSAHVSSWEPDLERRVSPSPSKTSSPSKTATEVTIAAQEAERKFDARIRRLREALEGHHSPRNADALAEDDKEARDDRR